MGKLTDKVAKGVFWVLMEKFGIQAVHFVVTLVLARLLTPNDYGTVALLSIFISLSNLLVDCGLGKALVRKKTATPEDYNTVFYLNLAFAFTLYALLFAAAPWVARFYALPELAPMLRIMALSLIFHSINGVQNVELNRKMLFHLSFRISWARVIVSSASGISFAYAGYGPWALVWSSLLGGITGVVARQIVIRWRPAWMFSWNSARELFGFGWKDAASSFLTHAYNEIYGLLIGKFYARSDLAFVKKGAHVPATIRSLASGTLMRVTLPALSKLQDDPRRLQRAMRRMIRCSTFVLLPMLVLLAISAEPLIGLLYGSKWLPCVPYLRIACISCAVSPFVAVNGQALMALGRSDIYFKIMVGYRILGLLVLGISLQYGVYAFYLSNILFSAIFGVIVWAHPNRKLLSYTATNQIADLLPSFVYAGIGGGVALLVFSLPFKATWLLFPAAFAGLAGFVLSAYFFRSPVLGEIVKTGGPQLVKKFSWGEAFVRMVGNRCGE